MDWLKSALTGDSDDSDTDENVKAASREGDVAKAPPSQESAGAFEDEVNDVTASVEDKSVEGVKDECSTHEESPKREKITGPPVSLFSLSTSSRKAEDYSKADKVEIRRILPEDAYESEGDYEEAEAPNISQGQLETAVPEAEPKAHGSLDAMEIMHHFNVIHKGGSVKAPKNRDWFGSNIEVIDINADQLRMDRIEKSKQYSMSKTALLEGRTNYKGPTRTLETDDGQVLLTNVLRKTSKRKHQISWLASEAQERELELLERTAQARKTKHETQMKYGW